MGEHPGRQCFEHFMSFLTRGKDSSGKRSKESVCVSLGVWERGLEALLGEKGPGGI